MKRLNHIYDRICSVENLMLADERARKGKRKQYGVRQHDKNREANILALHEMLKNKTYKTSAYKRMIVKDPKEREVFKLPYFPDRIVHHAVMNKTEKMFSDFFTADTYSCIRGRGVYKGAGNLRRALRDIPGTQFYLKLDIKKFYSNIDHDKLKSLLRRKIKDKGLLWLQDEIIDSAPGLPIGNYLSQPWANFYLGYFDHWVKEKMGVRYFFRYADDIVVLHHDKKYLHKLLHDIRQYLKIELKLEIKKNYRIAPVHTGLDFLGYVFRHEYIRIRKRTKRNLIRTVRYNPRVQSLASYNGHLSFGNCNTLRKKYLHGKVQ